jgi:hypothetical protein
VTEAPSCSNEQIRALFADEVLRIRQLWACFRALQRDVLIQGRAAAPTLFSTTEWALLSQVLLALSRLGDGRRTQGRDNLTLERAYESVARTGDTLLRMHYERAYQWVKEFSNNEDARRLRHRTLAHNDLSEMVLPSIDISIDDVHVAVRSLATFQVRLEAVATGQYSLATGEGLQPARHIEHRIEGEIDALVEAPMVPSGIYANSSN